MNAQTRIDGGEPILSPILDRGKTPAEWVAALAANGIVISERTLREKANRLHACHKLGRAMIITPEHMDTILQEGDPCHSNHISAATHGGRAGGSNISTGQSAHTTDAALEHLERLARGSGAKPKKNGSSVVTCLETKPPSHSRMP